MVHCRKNQASLTALEKSKFVAAVLALKASGKYDQYVAEHVNFMSSAHRAPAFLPWHREFLRRFELDLRAVDSSVTLPYWDWTVDNSPMSSIWGADFMGGNGRASDGQVMTGPFAHSAGGWTLTTFGASESVTVPYLRRRFGVSTPTLPTPMDVTNALAVTPYDAAPYNDGNSTAGFRNRVEGWFNGPQLHNRVHVWVGGSMLPGSSPNDPVFFLNHCFEDKLWADWQAMHPGEGYLPVMGGPAGHNLHDAMQPWLGLGDTVTPANMLDHHALGYAYDTEGVCKPTLKWLDEMPDVTLKFNDDVATLKLVDETLKYTDDPITLKFHDDVGTIKALDDPITLKFRDDLGTLPRLDVVKPVIEDIGGTDPRIDPVKQPGLDKPPGGDQLERPGTTLQEGVPFVLSTPHHSMAWTQSFPQSARMEREQLEAAIAQMEEGIREVNQRFEEGRLTQAEMQQADAVFQQYQQLLVEYQRMWGQ